MLLHNAETHYWSVGNRSYGDAGLANTRSHCATLSPSEGRSTSFEMLFSLEQQKISFHQVSFLIPAAHIWEFHVMSTHHRLIVPYCIVCQK